MDVQRLAELKNSLESNWSIAQEAFTRCPPQNARDFQVCECIRTTIFIVHEIVSMLQKDAEAAAATPRAPQPEQP